MVQTAHNRPLEARPSLELSGPVLNEALERIIAGCEQTVGVEAFVEALKLRAMIIHQVFDRAGPQGPDMAQFAKITSLMPTVRRRVTAYLTDDNYPHLIGACLELVNARHDPATVDQRLADFCAQFPQDSKHRWVKDLAAELLHAFNPERYPLMCRWVWDVRSNTGVIREIWHGDVDRVSIKVPDNYATFVMLREELSQFLATNGVYRDTLQYVDLLCAQIYAEYISAQGGSYLRADFSSGEDATVHVRRLLGLDGVRTKGDFANPVSALIELDPTSSDEA
ncbi:MAG: hypothetical protein R3C00_04820 [Hyphomonas sp.]|nr:hypothetical protein [Hyphomonas sp.]MCB9971273.1 hypothetical protein [Hyphomonas sp.]